MIVKLSSTEAVSVRTRVSSDASPGRIWITFYEDISLRPRNMRDTGNLLDVILKPEEAADLVAKILELDIYRD